MKLDLNKTNGTSPPAENDAITELYNQHDPLVRSLIWSHLRSPSGTFPSDSLELCDDLSQDIWLKIIQKYRAYQNRGYKITAWIGKIVKNHMLDWWRKRNNRQRLAPTQPLESDVSPDYDRRLSDSKLPARSKPVPQSPDQIMDPRTRYGKFSPAWGTSGD